MDYEDVGKPSHTDLMRLASEPRFTATYCTYGQLELCLPSVRVLLCLLTTAYKNNKERVGGRDRQSEENQSGLERDVLVETEE